MATMLETFPAAFRRRCRESANHVALREKRLGIWREHTWADYYARARAFVKSGNRAFPGQTLPV